MGISTGFVGRLRAAFAALTLLCVPLLLASCAANSYAGISFTPGAADPEVQALARRAQAGDKQAQLELGADYEEGRGVPVDLRRAARLYRLASSDSGGSTYVYTPPVGRHGRGRMVPVNSGPRQPGSPEARARLAALQSQEPRRGMSSSGEGEGDRGFRAAEHVLAAAIDIRRTQQDYLREVAGESPNESCRATRRCSYERSFDISLGVRSRVALLFSLDLSDLGDIACDLSRADNSCEISASVFVAGDETFPHCVAVGPVRRAAASSGWRISPYRSPLDPSVSRYRHMDDNNTFLFVRTIRDARCVRNIYIRRITPTPDPARN